MITSRVCSSFLLSKQAAVVSESNNAAAGLNKYDPRPTPTPAVLGKTHTQTRTNTRMATCERKDTHEPARGQWVRAQRDPEHTAKLSGVWHIKTEVF